MATQFLKVCYIFHPNYGCSLHTSCIKICNCKINKETSEFFWHFTWLTFLVYSLESRLLLEIKRVLL
jgi:hypothetical protein